MPTHLLIIDDDRELGQMLSEFLGADGHTVTVAGTADEGLQAAVSDRFDAIVLDVMLPDRSGFDVLRGIRAESVVPVIMLTARGEDTDRIVGLELGADDYLPKPFNPRELAARLRAILRRRHVDAPAADGTLVAGDIRLERTARHATRGGEALVLTAAEFAVLERLLLEPGEVVNKERLAEHALGRRLSPFDRSIDTHISRLRGKLGPLAGGEPRIQSVRGRGYVLVVQPQ